MKNTANHYKLNSIIMIGRIVKDLFSIFIDALAWHICDISLSFVILTRSSLAWYKLIIYRTRIEYNDPRCALYQRQGLSDGLWQRKQGTRWLASSSNINVDSITLSILQGQMPPTRRNHLHTFGGKYGDPIVPPFQVGSPGITNSDNI